MSGQVHLGVQGTGVVQSVTSERVQIGHLRLTQQIAYAEKADAHVWIVTVAHSISDDLAARIAHDPASVQPDLDAESIVVVGIGCYRCEEPLSARLLHRRCPGDPEGTPR
jgi:hypothetical protein